MPNEVARRGSAKDIPVIIGTNLEEWKLFGMIRPDASKIDDTEMANRLGNYIPIEDARDLIKAYREARQKRGEGAATVDIYSAINTDLMFRIPALRLVEAQRDNGQLAYNYLFAWKSPVLNGILGACHTLEIGFVFGKHDDMFCGSGPDADKLSMCIQDAWVAFASTGDPSCDCTGKWPVYGERRMTMILDKECHVEEAVYEDERRAWEKVSRIYSMP